jgi:hypothetical protein
MALTVRSVSSRCHRRRGLRSFSIPSTTPITRLVCNSRSSMASVAGLESQKVCGSREPL